ncbi:MAG: S1 RNA-binding domain-containing protein [Halanaerobium sp.]|nr:S1 RNA-binding domain-containing protein [Halanaerobium sp.]
MSIEVGNTVEGKVTGITNFGAFVELEGGKTGLIHISEVADTYVKDVGKYLKVDDEIKVKVISIDNKGKIGLSIRRLDDPSDKPDRITRKAFEEKMNKFLKESNERQQDLKKSFERRSGTTRR